MAIPRTWRGPHPNLNSRRCRLERNLDKAAEDGADPVAKHLRDKDVDVEAGHGKTNNSSSSKSSKSNNNNKLQSTADDDLRAAFSFIDTDHDGEVGTI